MGQDRDDDPGSRLRAIVAELCSPETAGREPGTAAGRAARDIVTRHMTELGLAPAGDGGFRQPVGDTGAFNVLGAMPGGGDRWVLLAAHYDHLGVWGGDVYWGANDNAAGVAVTLEVARRLTGRSEPLPGNVLFCSFDAEEPPNFLTPEMGSQWFVDHPTVPLDQVDLVIVLDLVGTALGPDALPAAVRESIFVQGAETSSGTTEQIDGVPAVAGIRPRHVPDWLIEPLSDHAPFRAARVPWVFYTGGRDHRYHTPADTPDHLDPGRMAALAAHLEAVIAATAAGSGRREYLSTPEPDGAVLTGLSDILTAVAAAFPAADAALDILRQIEAETVAGRIPAEHRDTVRFIAFMLEQELGTP